MRYFLQHRWFHGWHVSNGAWSTAFDVRQRGRKSSVVLFWNNEVVWQMHYFPAAQTAHIQSESGVSAEGAFSERTGILGSTWRWDVLDKNSCNTIYDRQFNDPLWGVLIETNQRAKVAVARKNFKGIQVVHRDSAAAWSALLVLIIFKRLLGGTLS